MGHPADFVPPYDFSDFQAENPTEPLPGAQVDATFALAATAINALIDRLSLVQRADGKLANRAVHVEALSAAVLALMVATSAAARFRGGWSSGGSYLQGDIVSSSGTLYLGLSNHTASANFASDLANGSWGQLSGGTASDISVTATGNLTATDVQAALAELDLDLTNHTGLTTGAHGLTAFGATLVASANATAGRTAMGVAIGSDVQAFDADIVKRDERVAYTAGQLGNITTLTDGANVAIDFGANGTTQVMQVTLAGNRTFTAVNLANLTAAFPFVLLVKQDANGTRVATWSSDFKFAGGTDPTLSTAANATDMISGLATVNGVYMGSLIQNLT